MTAGVLVCSMYYPLSTVKVSDHFELHLFIAERRSVRLLILQHIYSASVRLYAQFRNVSSGTNLNRRNLTYIARNYSASLEDFARRTSLQAYILIRRVSNTYSSFR